MGAMEMALHTRPAEPIELHAEVVRLQDCLLETAQEHAKVLAERDQRIEQLLDYIGIM